MSKESKAVSESSPTTPLIVTGVGLVNIATIFGIILRDAKGVWKDIINPYIFFPLAALVDIITAYFAWREAKRNGYKDASLLRKAGIEIFCATIVAIAIFISVLATASAVSISAFVVPIMFGAVMFFKMGNNFIEGCVALKQSKPAVPHFVGTLITGLIAAAVGVALIAGHAAGIEGLNAWSGLGIAAGIIGVGFTVYTGIKTCVQQWRQQANRSYRALGGEDSDSDHGNGQEEFLTPGVAGSPVQRSSATAVSRVAGGLQSEGLSTVVVGSIASTASDAESAPMSPDFSQNQSRRLQPTVYLASSASAGSAPTSPVAAGARRAAAPSEASPRAPAAGGSAFQYSNTSAEGRPPAKATGAAASFVSPPAATEEQLPSV